MFVDRQIELATLERLYASARAELFVVYGRRRVGKTDLLRAFCAGKPNLFYVATQSADTAELAIFSQQIWRFTHAEALEGFTYPTWEAAFTALAELPGRPVVVLDEFTYLIGGNMAVPSILQKVWDQSLQHANLLLILCGSYIGMMETEVLGYRAPLYGRRSGSLRLQPLELPWVSSFLPAYSAQQQIEAWAVLGGMPYYLASFSDGVGIMTNIHQHILDRRGLLFNEPRLLLLEELRQPRSYFSLLRAIALGRTRLNEIVQSSGLSQTAAASYLDVLQQLHLIERRVPATESSPEKSKRGLYQILDPFLRFWFRYVYPNLNSLELGLAEGILAQRVQPTFDQYVGYAFEEAARQYIARQAAGGLLPFLPERIGSWWDRQAEIDVVVVSESERAILVGECKWSISPVGLDIWEELQAKTAGLLANHPFQTVHYALFAKSGFTPALVEAARPAGVKLLRAETLLG
jgi:hypothetical protein